MMNAAVEWLVALFVGALAVAAWQVYVVVLFCEFFGPFIVEVF